MCGIFGLTVIDKDMLSCRKIKKIIDTLFLLSEARGKEASGLAIKVNGQIHVCKQPNSASTMIKSSEYQKLWRSLDVKDSKKNAPGLSIIGHSRLVTNGSQFSYLNNQPVVKNNLVCVHNGIVVNADKLWATNKELIKDSEVDTEVILSLFNYFKGQGETAVDSLKLTMRQITGTVSTAILSEEGNWISLFSNNGSLYYCLDIINGILLFASERNMLLSLWKKELKKLALDFEIVQLKPGDFKILNLENLSNNISKKDNVKKIEKANFLYYGPNSLSEPLPRCARCILPVSMPFISFDSQGVCNYCKNYAPYQVKPKEMLYTNLERYRRADGRPDCIVGLSGGRDSCYGLHVLKRELGMNPIAFTYDWGMVTDIARRNQARMCGELGIEHITISADLLKKRQNIGKNLRAWLKKPDLGMLPILTAGDKQFYHHANRLMKELEIPTLVFCENQQYEKTFFKSGFAGINEGGRRLFSLSMLEKIKMLSYYGRRILGNPAYINSSLMDLLSSYFSAYMLPHNYLYLFQYVRWNEENVNRVLIDQYGWEKSNDCQTTWRIGDATAPFYNYVYHSLAGFSEHDTFRSNQVREGELTRDEALILAKIDNEPRYESIAWYLNKVNVNFDDAMKIINVAKKII